MKKLEKEMADEKLHHQFFHPPFAFLKKVLYNFDEVGELLEIPETHSRSYSVCKHYKASIPKPAVCNLFDPEKCQLIKLLPMN